MSDIDKIEDPKLTIKQKCAECIKGPGNLIKTLIVLVCVGVVLQQIAVCIKKLIDIPITTYTHFDFNKTLMYPSVTFCREPPYKFGKMLDYGLYAHPRYTSTWSNFDFANVSLDKLWDDITFNETDMFLHAGLDGFLERNNPCMGGDFKNIQLTDTNYIQTRNNNLWIATNDTGTTDVELQPTMGFVLGRCYTMNPKVKGTQASSSTGYSVTLQHTAEDIATTTSILPPGYHVYIHYTREPFTEVTVYNGGLVDVLYVNVGETLQIKLKVDQYTKISSEEDPCINDDNYSANACTTKYVWAKSSKNVGCSGPWMESDLPRCDNSTSMSSLITNYLNTYGDHDCDECPRTCASYLYNGYVIDRQMFYTWDSGTKTWSVVTDASKLQTHVYLYFNSMMVSVYEERYNYDWNLFLSDLGGSVGFLLGLSVIGLLEICGKTWNIFLRPFIKSKKTGSVTSTDTADVKTRQEYIDEWDPKFIR